MNSKGIRVVIADDNKEFNFILCEYLNNQSGIEVIGSAHNGMDVIDLIVSKEPDIALLDMIMPQLDGIGVLKKIATMKLKKVPSFIILSAIGNKEITQQAMDLGAKLYLQKPFKMEVLKEKVEQLIKTNLVS